MEVSYRHPPAGSMSLGFRRPADGLVRPGSLGLEYATVNTGFGPKRTGMAKLMKSLRNLRILLTWKLALAIAAGAAVAGCEAHQISPPPVTVVQYEKTLGDSSAEYPPRTVVVHNLRRVLDPKLSEADRVASLALVKRLDQDDPDVRAQLTGILADEANGERSEEHTSELQSR